MKKSVLRSLIREQVRSVLAEYPTNILVQQRGLVMHIDPRDVPKVEALFTRKKLEYEKTVSKNVHDDVEFKFKTKQDYDLAKKMTWALSIY